MARWIRHTKDSLALLYFAQRHANQWHSYKQDKRTKRAIERALFLQAIEVNEYNQFRAATH